MSFEKHVGGAITSRDRRVLNREAPVKFVDPIVRQEESAKHEHVDDMLDPMDFEDMDESGFPIYPELGLEGREGWTEKTPHGIPGDLSYIDLTPWDAIPPLYMSEEQIMADLKRLTAEKGIRKHHPAVRQVVAQSLKPYPELLNHYMAS